MCYYIKYKSPIGLITIASDKESIIGLWIENQKYYQSTIDKPLKENNNIEALKKNSKLVK